MRRIHTAVRAVGVAVLAVTASGCWLQPGSNAGRSNWNPGETAITPANVDQLTELWNVDVGQLLNDPISVDGRLYVAEGYTNVHAVDPATGAVAWTHPVVPTDDPQVVICAFSPCKLFDPVSFEGTILVPYLGYPGGSGPSQGDAVRLEPATGNQVEGHGPGNHETEVAVAGGSLGAVWFSTSPFPAQVYVGHIGWKGISATHLAAVNQTDYQVGRKFAIVGESLLWSIGTKAEAFSPACPRQPPPNEATCSAPDWQTDLGGLPGQPAAVGASAVAYSTAGTTSVLDVTTGAVLWTAPVSGQLAVTDDLIVVANNARIVALPAAGCGAATCVPLWEGTVGVGPMMAPVIVGGDVVYMVSGTQLLAFDVNGCGAATCAPLATVDIGHTPTSLIVDGGRVFVGSGDGALVAFGLPD